MSVRDTHTHTHALISLHRGEQARKAAMRRAEELFGANIKPTKNKRGRL